MSTADMTSAAGGAGEALPAAGTQLDVFAEAEARKQQGMAIVDNNADQWWKDCADHAIRHLASVGEVFQTYDVALMGVPEPHHPNAWGARMNAAHKAGLIVPAGHGPSKRPTTAKSLVHLWRGAVRDA